MSEGIGYQHADGLVLGEIIRRMNREQGNLRLALCIEGGGMRSVVSAGMSCALLDNGIKPEHFDAVFGTSGGAFNAAYYVAEQSHEGTAGYWEDAGKDLIDFRRLIFGRRPAIDMEHMILGMQHSKPLDFNAVIDSKKLRPIAADMIARKSTAFEPAQTKEELLWQLRATSAVPVLGRGRVNFQGTEYLDGGMFERVPFQTPVDLGYDALLVLLTRGFSMGMPANAEISRYKRIKETLGRLHPDFFNLAFENPLEKHENARRLSLKSDNPPFVWAISPPDNIPGIGRFSLETEIIKTGAQVGQIAVEQALSFVNNKS